MKMSAIAATSAAYGEKRYLRELILISEQIKYPLTSPMIDFIAASKAIAEMKSRLITQDKASTPATPRILNILRNIILCSFLAI